MAYGEDDEPQTQPEANDDPVVSDRRFSTKQRVIAALVAFVVLIVLFQVVAFAIRSHKTVHNTYGSEITRVELDVSSAGVSLVAGDGTLDVDSKLTYTLRKPSISEKVDGSTLKIKQRCSGIRLGTCTVGYTIAVPSGVSVSAKSGNGAIKSKGLRSDLDAKTDNGSIKIDGSYARLGLTSGNGAISAVNLQSLDAKANSDNGKIDLSFSGSPNNVEAISGNGAVSVEVPKRSDSYKVTADSGNGKTTIDVKTDANAPRTIRAHSDNGSVTVGRN